MEDNNLQLDVDEQEFLRQQLQASTDESFGNTAAHRQEQQQQPQNYDLQQQDSQSYNTDDGEDQGQPETPWNLNAPPTWQQEATQQQQQQQEHEQHKEAEHGHVGDDKKSEQVGEHAILNHPDSPEKPSQKEQQQQCLELQQLDHVQSQDQQPEHPQAQDQQQQPDHDRRQHQQEQHQKPRKQKPPSCLIHSAQSQEQWSSSLEAQSNSHFPHLGTTRAPSSPPHGARPPPVYVVAPPALVMDPALNPQDTVGMTGQRNTQPCPYRHARKLASTYELEQQLAAVFEEGEGEEATALKVDIVDNLCRKYNRTAMSLLETQAYAQAKELLQKTLVLSEENGILATYPALRMRLHSITLNNMGCYHCRCSKLPPALKALQAAVALEQQAAEAQGQGQQQDTWGRDIGEDPASTLLNLCAVLGMLGRHKEALQKAKDVAQMICRANSLDQEQMEDWCCAHAPPPFPPYVPHAKFGHDPSSGRPYTAPFPAAPPPPAPLSTRSQPSFPPGTAPGTPQTHSTRAISSPPTTSISSRPVASPSPPASSAPATSLPNDHAHNMRARNHRPSPLGIPQSPVSVSRKQSSHSSTDLQLPQSPLQAYHRLHQKHMQSYELQPHHPYQGHPSHSHSHHLHGFGGGQYTALPPNSSVEAYKKYDYERRLRRTTTSHFSSTLPSIASPSCASPGLPQTPLPPDAPYVAYLLRSLPLERVNLLVMAYFSQAVQSEHLGELRDAFRAYALASILAARVFGRSSHLAVRFTKSFHAFKIKHLRYFNQQQEQELREAREMAKARGELTFNNLPNQRRNVSIATLLGTTRICHPPPESSVRKQILDSYAQDYEPAPPEPEPKPTSTELMQLHMQKLQDMKKGRLVFL